MMLFRWFKIALIMLSGLISQSVIADTIDMSEGAFQDCVAEYQRDVCELRCQHSEAVNCRNDCEGEEAEHVCHERILEEQESGNIHEWEHDG